MAREHGAGSIFIEERAVARFGVLQHRRRETAGVLFSAIVNYARWLTSAARNRDSARAVIILLSVPLVNLSPSFFLFFKET